MSQSKKYRDVYELYQLRISVVKKLQVIFTSCIRWLKVVALTTFLLYGIYPIC